MKRSQARAHPLPVPQILEDAISRQSTRVWEEGTVSFAGLTMLVEADFQDPEQASLSAVANSVVPPFCGNTAAGGADSGLLKLFPRVLGF